MSVYDFYYHYKNVSIQKSGRGVKSSGVEVKEGVDTKRVYRKCMYT